MIENPQVEPEIKWTSKPFNNACKENTIEACVTLLLSRFLLQ